MQTLLELHEHIFRKGVLKNVNSFQYINSFLKKYILHFKMQVHFLKNRIFFQKAQTHFKLQNHFLKYADTL